MRDKPPREKLPRLSRELEGMRRWTGANQGLLKRRWIGNYVEFFDAIRVARRADSIR